MSVDRITRVRIAGALAMPLVAFGIQRGLWPTTQNFTCLLFYPAIFLSSWLGGFFAGLTSTVVSVAMVWFFFMPPEGNMNPAHMVSLGVFVGMSVLVTTLHDRLRAATQHAAETSAQIHRLREEWATIVAHDLQQPINAIALRAGLLLRGGSKEQFTADVEEIRTSAKRLGRMVDDLCDASLLEVQRMRLVTERLDLVALARATVHRLPGAEGRAIVRSCAGQIWAFADSVRIEQIITNLVCNAMKYGDQDAPISIAIEQSEAEAHVSITNSGQRIPQSAIPHLFERYARTPAAEASGIKGSGLGLYIAKGLVEAHHGRIWVESSDSATTFHFTLPISARSLATGASEMRASAETARHAERHTGSSHA